MNEILTQLSPLAIALFLATAMFGLGLDLTIGQIVTPLRNYRLMGRGLLAGICVTPLVAWTLTNLIPMDEATQIGFLLVALSAGAEAGPKFVQMAKGNSALALSLMAVMLAVTVLGLPLAVSILVPEAEIQRGVIMLKLLLTVAAPVGIGLFIRSRNHILAARLSHAMHRLSMILLLMVLAQLFYSNFATIMSVGPSTFTAALLLFAITGSIGYALGGPSTADRRTLSIMTFARPASISIMLASQAFTNEPKVMAVTVTLALMIFASTSGLTVWFRRTAPAGLEGREAS